MCYVGGLVRHGVVYLGREAPDQVHPRQVGRGEGQQTSTCPYNRTLQLRVEGLATEAINSGIDARHEVEGRRMTGVDGAGTDVLVLDVRGENKSHLIFLVELPSMIMISTYN